MTPVLSYLLKANIVLCALYGLYFLCFRRDTFYGYIRWYLLAAIVSAMIFPLADISVWLTDKPAAMSVTQYFPDVDAAYQYVFTQLQPEHVAEPATTQTISFALIVWLLWLAVAVFLLGKRLFQLACIIRLWHSYPQRQNSGVTAVDSGIRPFSFFGRIFLNPALHSKDELDEIITHEQVHCRQGHTVDNLLSEALVCLCWFNPIAWLLRRDLKQNLEYFTDRMTLRQGFDRKHYQYSLLRVCLWQDSKFGSGNAFQIVNHFHLNHIKKRIVMMNKKQSPRIMSAKYLLVIPALAAVLLTVQVSGLQAQKTEAINAIDESFMAEQTTPEIFQIQEEAQQRMLAIQQRPQETLQQRWYPAQPVIKGVGQDTLAPLYVVDGKVTANNIEIKDLDPNSIESVTVLKGKNATDLYGEKAVNGVVIIASKNEMNPASAQEALNNAIAATRVTLQEREVVKREEPIVIGIPRNMSQEPEEAQSTRLLIMGQNQPPSAPLYVIDGKMVANDVDMKNLDLNSIESISVLKNKNATDLYGEKAANGVIFITTKKETNSVSSQKDNAATIHVFGTVTSSAIDGQPLQGVFVTVKGIDLGVATDMNGKYSMIVPADATLRFTYAGMVTAEVAVGNQHVINVALTSETK